MSSDITPIAALPAVAAAERALTAAVDPDRMMRDVAFLSTLQRHAGTEDEAAAFEEGGKHVIETLSSEQRFRCVPGNALTTF